MIENNDMPLVFTMNLAGYMQHVLQKETRNEQQQKDIEQTENTQRKMAGVPIDERNTQNIEKILRL